MGQEDWKGLGKIKIRKLLAILLVLSLMFLALGALA